MIILPNNSSSRLLKLKNSVVIRQGINTDKFKPLSNLSTKNKFKLNISYVGHPSPAKGLIEAVGSLSKFKSNKNIIKNIFLSYTNPQINKWIKKHGSEFNVFGFRKNLVKDYNNSDIILLPYRHSAGTIANPLVLLEAMACGKAIITTNLPHLKEICRDSVIYVEPYSIKQIVKAIKLLSEKPDLRKRLGRKARQFILDNYNEKIMIKKYQKINNKIH